VFTLAASPRPSRPDPILTQILRGIEKIPLDEPSDLVCRSRSDDRRRLEPPGCFLQKIRSPALVDRLG
jgi:hypothetical protein